MSTSTFAATVQRHGKTATGIEVPADVVASLGAGKRLAVRVTVGPYSYSTTIGFMGGRYLIPLSAEHRTAAGVAAGDTVEVHVENDTAERDVPVPADLADALAKLG